MPRTCRAPTASTSARWSRASGTRAQTWMRQLALLGGPGAGASRPDRARDTADGAVRAGIAAGGPLPRGHQRGGRISPSASAPPTDTSSSMPSWIARRASCVPPSTRGAASVALSETGLIERYFRACGAQRADVALGIGDDAALVSVPAGCELVATTDTLVAGVHFPHGSPPGSIGHRALAVNLSDIAAMGARPAWALLALTLPQADEAWLREFAAGFGGLAREHRVALGRWRHHPRSAVCHRAAAGRGRRRRRPAAQRRTGRRWPVRVRHARGCSRGTGRGAVAPAGAARAARLPARALPAARRRAWRSASACADSPAPASMCPTACSGMPASLRAPAASPRSWSSRRCRSPRHCWPSVGEERARLLALTGGDDYELCFAVPPRNWRALAAELPPAAWGYTRIGTCGAGAGAAVVRAGTVMEFSHSGYQHFA